MTHRIGHGFDVHAFKDGDHVMLGGVRVSHDRGIDAQQPFPDQRDQAAGRPALFISRCGKYQIITERHLVFTQAMDRFKRNRKITFTISRSQAVHPAAGDRAGKRIMPPPRTRRNGVQMRCDQ